MDLVWLIALLVTHICAYCMGKTDGLNQVPEDDVWVEVKRYEIDKRFEHMRWLEERKADHDQG